MKRSSGIVVAAVLVAVGCDEETDHPTRDPSRPPAASKASHYVASPTLGRGSEESLFAIPGLGRFRAACVTPGRARISYRAAPGSASQSVTVETATRRRPTVSLDPGDRMAVDIDRDVAPRADWQVAVISEGRVDEVTGSFTVTSLKGSFGCFVAAKADRAGGRR